MKNEFVEYVKSIYPNMVEDFWFDYGELHFYKNEHHAETGEPYACVKRNGKFVILTEF